MSDKLKSIIIRYHEVEKYIAFGSEVNQETLETIELGKRIYQIFNQTVSELFTYEQEVAILALVISKKILSWDVEQMHELRQQLVLYVKENPQRLKEIIEVEYTDNTESQIDDYISGFISLPTTLKPKIKEAATEAEKETIIDVLKGNPQDAIIGNLKK
ncbi:MAG: F0F1 ATP synthase subunit alpha [bacterium ADurb.Bin212]|nr:MAG: F0F1 ATP synthase subunit alpha [bacterium ADurb.Bin212]